MTDLGKDLAVSDAVMALVADELRSLHGALSTVSEEEWEKSSLCEGWTIRHVVAHLTMPARFTPEQFGAELAAVQFDFGALSNLVAERDSALPVHELLDGLLSERLAAFTTPDGGPVGALSHVVIHGLDATVPLGLGCVATPEALRLVLDSMAGDGVHRHFGTSIDGRRLVASDLAWAHGEGTTETAPAYALLLDLAGRKAPFPLFRT